MKKNVTITLVLLFVLASCQKNVVEYPVFYWPNKGIELDYTLTFDNCQFNSLCNEKVKAALLAFVEHSSYDSYILDIEQKGDSVGFVATGHDLSFLLYYSFILGAQCQFKLICRRLKNLSVVAEALLIQSFHS